MLSIAPALTVPRPARLPAVPMDAPAQGLPVLRWQGADIGGRGLLDCTAWPGELVHLDGGSRAQQLRVLAQAAGLQAPAAGRCQLLGRLAVGQRWAPDLLAHVLRDDPLPPGLPVPGFVAAPLLQDGLGVRDALMRAELELYLLGASHLRQRPAERLLPTEARLARLARAMVTRPALLVLAWPDEGLPAAQCDALRQALLTLACTFRSCVLLTSDHPRLQASADRHIDLERLG